MGGGSKESCRASLDTPPLCEERKGWATRVLGLGGESGSLHFGRDDSFWVVDKWGSLCECPPGNGNLEKTQIPFGNDKPKRQRQRQQKTQIPFGNDKPKRQRQQQRQRQRQQKMQIPFGNDKPKRQRQQQRQQKMQIPSGNDKSKKAGVKATANADFLRDDKSKLCCDLAWMGQATGLASNGVWGASCRQ